MARQREHRVVVRRGGAPPPPPPPPPARAPRDKEPLVYALRAALLADHAPAVTGREAPLVQPLPADAERVVKALRRPRAVPVDRDREVMAAQFRHGSSP